MSIKRVVGAAAVAAGLGISAVTLDAGFANSAPQDPPTPSPQGPETTAPQTTAPQTTAPQTTAPQTTAPQTTTPPSTQATTPSSTQATTPSSTQTTTPSSTQTTTSPQSTQTTSPAGTQTTPPSAQTTTPAGTQTTAPQGPQITLIVVAPSTQPPHPPYIPVWAYERPSAQWGGPRDLPRGFLLPDRGIRPPPPRGWGWNDGPAPGHAPRGWEGPPPPGGWDGPPPPGGWNRPWGWPPRDWDRGRADFGPFDNDGFTAIPVFNWQYGGWGYWFFGVWVPLY
jgi:hypothetical protein